MAGLSGSYQFAELQGALRSSPCTTSRRSGSPVAARPTLPCIIAEVVDSIDSLIDRVFLLFLRLENSFEATVKTHYINPLHVYAVKVLGATRRKIAHFRDVMLPASQLALRH